MLDLGLGWVDCPHLRCEQGVEQVCGLGGVAIRGVLSLPSPTGGWGFRGWSCCAYEGAVAGRCATSYGVKS